MRRSMNMKGFLLILGALFLVFFVCHRMLRGTLDEKTERETALRATLTRLEQSAEHRGHEGLYRFQRD